MNYFNSNDFNKNNRDKMINRLEILRETKNWNPKDFDTKEKMISEIDRLKQSLNREEMPSAYYENIQKNIDCLEKQLLDFSNSEVKALAESVLDPIQKYRCAALFGPENTEDSPKMLKETREFLINLLDKFLHSLEIPGVKAERFFMVGSSLGKQYRDNSDIDCDVVLNVTKEQMQGKWYLCPKGIMFPKTSHPVNIFVLCKDDKEYNFEENCENAYDIIKNEWIKQGSLKNQDPIPMEYIAGISQFIMDGMTLQLDRARRDIEDIKRYIALDPKKFEVTEKERDDAISDKIAELQVDIDALNLAHHLTFMFETEGFEGIPFKVSIEYTASAKHFTINNLLYKYIDRFGYYDKINAVIKELKETIKEAKEIVHKDTGNEIEKSNVENVQKEVNEESLKEAEDVESVNNKTTVLNNLRSDIQDEYTAIKGYDAHADFAEKNNYPDIAKILRDIRDEEKTHVGELEAIMKKYDKEFKDSLTDGGKEAEEILKESFLIKNKKSLQYH